MCATVNGAVKSPTEKTPAEKPRKEDDECEECGQQEQISRERQCPEAEEREQGEKDNDVDANETVDRCIREQPSLIEHIADDERQNQVGEEIDETRVNVIHDFPNFRNRYVRSS